MYSPYTLSCFFTYQKPSQCPAEFWARKLVQSQLKQIAQGCLASMQAAPSSWTTGPPSYIGTSTQQKKKERRSAVSSIHRPTRLHGTEFQISLQSCLRCQQSPRLSAPRNLTGPSPPSRRRLCLSYLSMRHGLHRVLKWQPSCPHWPRNIQSRSLRAPNGCRSTQRT